MKIHKHISTTSSLFSARKKLGLTQQQLADKLEISRCMVTLTEQGKRSLSTTALLKLAQLQIDSQGDTEQQGSVGTKETDYISAKHKRSHSLMQIKEMGCRLNAQKLIISLERMKTEYERINKWLISAEGNLPANAVQMRQQEALKKRIVKCSLPAQALLQHEIALQQAKAELYKGMLVNLKI